MERVDLCRRYPGVRGWWRDGDPWAGQTRHVLVGVLPDGRWYAATSHPLPWARSTGCAYAGPHAEHYARSTARRWRRTFGGTWVEA
jgi:hypothetical protein